MALFKENLKDSEKTFIQKMRHFIISSLTKFALNKSHLMQLVLTRNVFRLGKQIMECLIHQFLYYLTKKAYC